jgi:hypothetical protein
MNKRREQKMKRKNDGSDGWMSEKWTKMMTRTSAKSGV